MERIAIISDIHGNVTALNAVLQDIKNKSIKRIFCLGDIVLKGANPDIVIDLVRQNCEVIVKGNCDEAIASERALQKGFWTRVKIGEERACFLKNLPISYDFYMSGHLVRIFHSSPVGLDYICNPAFSNENNRYAKLEINNPLRMFENTDFLGKSTNERKPDIVGYGHIHTPNLFRYQNKLLFNTGSVGSPNEMLNFENENDLTNKFSTLASYSILEGEYGSTEISSITIGNARVVYNVEEEIKKLQASDMPYKEQSIYTLKTASTYYKNCYDS